MNKAQRTLQIEKIINAPLKLVWKAWTAPEHVMKWWSPEGMETEIDHYEFREGSIWKYIMKMPNGQRFIADGRFTEIETPLKILTEANFRQKQKVCF